MFAAKIPVEQQLQSGFSRCAFATLEIAILIGRISPDCHLTKASYYCTARGLPVLLNT
jgi:hypothetical protein